MTTVLPTYRADPHYDALGGEDGAPFYDIVEPAAFPAHILRYRNQRWAEKIGLSGLSEDEWIAHFGQFRPLPDNFEKPLAIRYHGHQFRAYNPDIGDGRGFLFAQLRDGQSRLLDLGTKGSGQTPYSRFGDGRLTLKGGVREALATEMLEALGVYTSKSLSLIETGEALHRHDEPSPARSSVLVRLSHSHVRFGVFQRLAYEKNDAAIAELVDYCVTHFDGDLKTESGAKIPPLEKGGSGGDRVESGAANNPPRSAAPAGPPFQGGQSAVSAETVVRFFERVVERTARLVAQWMAAGFVHGVLNTDNMNVTGESFDYGPWRFAPVVDPDFTAAYFDETGLYAYGRQAEAGAWNLAQLGGALARLAGADALTDALRTFGAHYEKATADAFFRRLGLRRTGEGDARFVGDLLQFLTETGAPFEQAMFDWFGGRASAGRAKESPIAEIYDAEGFAPVKEKLLAFAPAAPERLDHPYFKGARPCTMLIDEMEALWAEIAAKDDWSAFNAKLGAIAQMREAYGFPASDYAPLSGAP